ncbi:hypothetical protein [Phenylobacterium sp.]|jgi:hypothetical protein|uniref:hypothetical protein n=1 Tax=Phenylobacterium sp. TaxID=1871053 RepID=UPI002F3FF167
MDIHKPKPWHGLREFLKEYVIIVVGVLTALGAEQTVEWLHWRHEVHVAREAIAFDLKKLIGGAAAQDAHTICTARRLREIGAILNQAQISKRLPPMGWRAAPPTAGWTLQSWSALTSGQTLPHFSNREQLILSGLASSLEGMRAARAAEVDDWSTLRILAGPGRPISDAEIAAGRIALSHAYRDAYTQRSTSRVIETVIASSDFLSTQEVDAAYQEGIGLAFGAGICKPTPPAATDAADDLEKGLTSPATKPGATQIINPGVGRAFTTER